jgi:hypothetical protein
VEWIPNSHHLDKNGQSLMNEFNTEKNHFIYPPKIKKARKMMKKMRNQRKRK